MGIEKGDLCLKVNDNGILNVRVGAIIKCNGKLLFVGNSRDNYYYSVGGRIKFGETAEQAVIREVEEETGVKMTVDRLGFIHENFFYGDVGLKKDNLIHEISWFFYMNVPKDFKFVCKSYTEDDCEERLCWVDKDTKEKVFPNFYKLFFEDECGVRHIVTDER